MSSMWFWVIWSFFLMYSESIISITSRYLQLCTCYHLKWGRVQYIKNSMILIYRQIVLCTISTLCTCYNYLLSITYVDRKQSLNVFLLLLTHHVIFVLLLIFLSHASVGVSIMLFNIPWPNEVWYTWTVLAKYRPVSTRESDFCFVTKLEREGFKVRVSLTIVLYNCTRGHW